MNELDFAKKVTQQLNRSSSELDQTIVSRLKAARERALAAYRAEPVWAHAHGLGGGRWSDYLAHHPRLAWGALAAVAALVMTVGLWQNEGRMEGSPVDAQILASDLPLNAFTHQDFDQWLKKTSQ